MNTCFAGPGDARMKWSGPRHKPSPHFHGDPAHGGNYQHGTLATWARRIDDWRGQKLDIFIYFNNDVGGYALENAKTLRRLLAEY